MLQREPHKQNTDSEKKRKEKETVDPPLMGAQGPESDQNMQERMRVESSSRMENLAKTETNEQNPDSEKKRTERERQITHPSWKHRIPNQACRKG